DVSGLAGANVRAMAKDRHQDAGAPDADGPTPPVRPGFPGRDGNQRAKRSAGQQPARRYTAEFHPGVRNAMKLGPFLTAVVIFLVGAVPARPAEITTNGTGGGRWGDPAT